MKHRSTSIVLQLSMQLVNVIPQAKQQIFRANILLPTQQESPEAIILFQHTKSTLDLDRPVHAQQNAKWRRDVLIGFLAMLQECFGDLQTPISSRLRTFRPNRTADA